MRVILQRVKKASVSVDGKVIGEIGLGFVLLVGVGPQDTEEDASYLADKCAHLRIFDDDEGKMNCSILDVGGEVLVISQFTLYGDCRKGRRPSFTRAASPDRADVLYEKVKEYLGAFGINVQGGQFGAKMLVNIWNDGPVTFILEST